MTLGAPVGDARVETLRVALPEVDPGAPQSAAGLRGGRGHLDGEGKWNARQRAISADRLTVPPEVPTVELVVMPVRSGRHHRRENTPGRVRTRPAADHQQGPAPREEGERLSSVEP